MDVKWNFNFGFFWIFDRVRIKYFFYFLRKMVRLNYMRMWIFNKYLQSYSEVNFIYRLFYSFFLIFFYIEQVHFWLPALALSACNRKSPIMLYIDEHLSNRFFVKQVSTYFRINQRRKSMLYINEHFVKKVSTF